VERSGKDEYQSIQDLYIRTVPIDRPAARPYGRGMDNAAQLQRLLIIEWWSGERGRVFRDCCAAAERIATAAQDTATASGVADGLGFNAVFGHPDRDPRLQRVEDGLAAFLHTLAASLDLPAPEPDALRPLDKPVRLDEASLGRHLRAHLLTDNEDGCPAVWTHFRQALDAARDRRLQAQSAASDD